MLAMADAAAPDAFRASASGVTFGKLSRLAFALLAYTILVLLFGAVVRVTGSGAGCGQHWPTCEGEVGHVSRLIEKSHRVSSGLVLVFGIGLAWLLARRLPLGHRARRVAIVGVGFTLIDALIGAVLVLGAYVGKNTSAARALIMPLHLVSTCGLSAGFLLAAFWADEGARAPRVVPKSHRLLVTALLAAFVVVAGMGAVTALGDTLYPVEVHSLAARASETATLGGHFLQRLRIVHPLLAGTFALAVFTLLPPVTRTAGGMARRFCRATLVAMSVELALGIVNVLLSAPAWMQIVHLAAALLLWLSLVLVSAEVVAPRGA